MWLALFLGDGAAAAPPAHWVADIDVSKHLFHTREVDLTRRDRARVELELRADGTARFEVAHRAKTETRRSRYANPDGEASRSNTEHQAHWQATGRFEQGGDGTLAVRLDRRQQLSAQGPAEAVAWTLSLQCMPIEPSGTTLVTIDPAKRTSPASLLGCTGLDGELAHLGVVQESLHPWPGTRWLTRADPGRSVLVVGSPGVRVRGVDAEMPAELTLETVSASPPEP